MIVNSFSGQNSYFVLALDTGWIGVISYVTALVMIVVKLYSNAVMYGKAGNEKGKRICVAGYAVLIYLMGVMLFSNHIQDMEVVTLVICMLVLDFHMFDTMEV